MMAGNVQCIDCGKHLSASSVYYHMKNSCKAKKQQTNKEALALESFKDVGFHPNCEKDFQQTKNPQLTASVVNKIINTTPNGHVDGMIQPSIGNGKDNSIRNPDKIPIIHETAKQIKIIPESDDESEGSIVGDEYESEEEDEDMEVDPTNENETVI